MMKFNAKLTINKDQLCDLAGKIILNLSAIAGYSRPLVDLAFYRAKRCISKSSPLPKTIAVAIAGYFEYWLHVVTTKVSSARVRTSREWRRACHGAKRWPWLDHRVSSPHYYKTLICPGWETPVVPVSQPGTPVRDKGGALLSRVWQPGQKRTFCPGW